MYIKSVAANNVKTAKMMPITKLGDLHELILDRKGFALQRIIGSDREVKVVGSAIFRGHDIRMTGNLGSEETVGLNILTGKVKSGILKVKLKDNLTVYEMMKSKRHIAADVSDPQHIRFTIHVDTEGFIIESLTPIDFMNKKELKKLEESMAQEINRMTGETIRKLQKDLKADAIGLGSYLEQEYYPVWKQIANHWDQNENLFSQCSIKVEAKVRIRRTGTINRTYH
jgi:spore germination protein